MSSAFHPIYTGKKSEKPFRPNPDNDNKEGDRKQGVRNDKAEFGKSLIRLNKSKSVRRRKSRQSMLAGQVRRDRFSRWDRKGEYVVYLSASLEAG